MVKSAWVRQLSLIIFLGSVTAVSGAEVEIIPLEDSPPPKPQQVVPSVQKWRVLEVTRAEVAAFQGDWPTVSRIVNEVEPWLEPDDPLYKRLEAVKKQLLKVKMPKTEQQLNAPLAREEYNMTGVLVARISRQLFQVQHPFLVLLPLSGPYQAAGEAILSELKNMPGFSAAEVLDTALFTPDELVNLIQTYQPEWLLGPLRPQVADKVLSAVATIPALTFLNHCPESLSNCVALVPSVKNIAIQQFAKLNTTSPTLRIVESAFWKKLPPKAQKFLMQASPDLVQLHLSRSQHQLARLFNLNLSQQRSYALHRLVHHALVSVSRARQDIGYVIFLGSLDGAYQIRSLLNFWHLPVKMIWLPGELFSPQRMQALLPTWPATTALLLPFLVQKKPHLKELGIFHAIGKTARLVLSWPKRSVVTPLGVLQYDTERKESRLFVPWMELHYGHVELQQDGER